MHLPVTGHDVDASAVDETIDGETNGGGQCQADFEMTLVHTLENDK